MVRGLRNLFAIFALTIAGGILAAYVDGKRAPIVEAFFQGRCSALSPCHQLCVDLVGGGFECACRQGFTLQANGFSCFPTLSFSDDDSAEDDKRTTVTSFSRQNDADIAVTIRNRSEPRSSKNAAEDSPSRHSPANGSSPRLHNALYGYMFADAAATGHSGVNYADDDDVRADVYSYSKPEARQTDDYDDVYVDKKKKTSAASKLKRDDRRQVGGRRQKHVQKEQEEEEEEEGEVRDAAGFDPDRRSRFSGVSRLHQEFSSDSSRTSSHRDAQLSSWVPGDLSSGPASAAAGSCEELHCAANGRCVHEAKTGGVRCLCPLGTQGQYCERDLVAKYPKFAGQGYIAFPVLRGAHREFTLTLDFRPETNHGLLLFSADHPHARFDFFSVSLVNGLVEFRFDCGSGMAIIRSSNAIRVGQWNRIVIQRNEWNAGLRLNNGTISNGRSKGKFSHINFREDLYLGGYTALAKISDRIGIHQGFAGCVRHLQVNEKVYDMRKGAFVGDAIQGLDIEDCSSNVCLHLQCLNGGSCVANGADVAICLCPMATAGHRCESRVDVHVPMFVGTSFLQFIGLQRNVLSFTEIEMVVKPTAADGLIFYNGYARDRRTGDFIALALRNGHVEYRFDLGTGAAFIRSPHPIDLNQWHTIRFSRTGRNGFLKVDDQRLVEGMASGAFTQLTLTLDLFIGGHRNFDEVAKAAQATKSFQGCIQKVIINKRPIKLLEEMMTGINVGSCDHPCGKAPCLNRGKCIPIKESYRCNCPLHYHSKNCEDLAIEPIKVPTFSGDSYLLFIDPLMTQRTRGKNIDIQMWMKPRHPDGLLFWVSEEETSPYSDYLAIGMKGGFAHLSYNLGSGEVVITNNYTRIDDNRWHRLRILRWERNGSLQIDDWPIADGVSPGNMKQLTTHGTIFIGGMDDIVHGTLHKYSAGFVGCIANVTIAAEYQLDLIAEADEGSNIKQCQSE